MWPVVVCNVERDDGLAVKEALVVCLGFGEGGERRRGRLGGLGEEQRISIRIGEGIEEERRGPEGICPKATGKAEARREIGESHIVGNDMAIKVLDDKRRRAVRAYNEERFRIFAKDVGVCPYFAFTCEPEAVDGGGARDERTQVLAELALEKDKRVFTRHFDDGLGHEVKEAHGKGSSQRRRKIS